MNYNIKLILVIKIQYNTMSAFTSRELLDQESNEGQYFRPISVRFKKVSTNNIKYYMINPDWTTRQLYEFIKPYIVIDFELVPFDIVEVGLPLAERAEAVQITNNIRVREMFRNLDHLCFYVRSQNVENNRTG